MALTPLVVAAGFNWLVDPYNIWNSPAISGLTATKSQLGKHERIFKTVGLARQAANTVILGTSRAANGLRPTHSALGTSAVNLAMAGQPYRETRMLFDWLNDREIAKHFVIGLDFFVANSLLPEPVTFVAENYASGRAIELSLSGSVLVDSVITILKRNDPLTDIITDKGLNLGYEENVKSGGGHRKVMIESEKSYLDNGYLPRPSCSFDFGSTSKNPSRLEQIRAVFSRAHRNHIALKLLISPSHARQWETLSAAGLWNKWEEWKHLLVKMNEEEAQRAGQPPFPLWDFSGYDSISTEEVPGLGDAKTIMRWYSDSSHYTPAAGDLVLDRLFNFKSPDRTVPNDFGVLLTIHNIDDHLAHIRAARERYRQTHAQDIQEIETAARDVAKVKRCRVVK